MTARNESDKITRRSILASTAVAGAMAALPKIAFGQAERVVVNGRIKQSVCGGVLRKARLSLDDECALLARMGIVGKDLVGPNDWPTLKKHGLVATMVPGAGSIKDGLNNKARHPEFLEAFKKNILAAAAYKWPNVICMAGDRKGISDEEGMDNCQVILKEAVKIAEDNDVTICMELLNSKVDHPGYMCDKSEWGFELCRRVNSPRFKMLYDIYHMQIMEGDLIATIRNNIRYIGHFHTAGVPGRHELDENQEIYYPAVMRAIVETGYTGYVAHEYTPVRDAVPSLIQAIKACDV
ncbi:MAG TPA: TIM barrel protein [Anaerohalosphaeraceae bacterium]|jgi:hydroxypyruvate isomerase|nr:TIM barrel protein [Anaerohalosphaeraceae bacterium]HRT49376.1 TIM barrel protein [Anaerohalosphaeraceae bacterium]HRT85895.1 TIM barrel protein [Anaerohalosphaeraceae bacterium]